MFQAFSAHTSVIQTRYINPTVFKLLGVWFGPDLQVDKNWGEVTSRVASLTQKWAERKLSLKGRAEVANAYIASVI